MLAVASLGLEPRLSPAAVSRAPRPAETAGICGGGLTGVGLVCVALMHLQKLHQARLRMEGGFFAAKAVRTLHQPVFYRAVPGMTASVGLWPAELLLRALEEARAVELACKTTGSRPDVLACRFVAALARQAQARRGR